VIISSHILAEISEICHKIMIIVKGKLVAIDTPENLAKMIGGDIENMSLEDIFLKFVEKEGQTNADSI